MDSSNYNPNLSDDPPTRCKQYVSMLRMIVIALFVGLLAITGIFTFLIYGGLFPGGVMPGGNPLFGPDIPSLTLIGILILAVILLAAYAVSRSMVSSYRRRLGMSSAPPLDRFVPDANDLTWTQQLPKAHLFSLLEGYQVERITRLALFEGAGTINAIFFFLEGHGLALGATACCLALIAAQFPSPASLNSWLRSMEG